MGACTGLIVEGGRGDKNVIYIYMDDDNLLIIYTRSVDGYHTMVRWFQWEF